jgi:hypothetical protein
MASIPGPLIVNPLSGGAFNGPPRFGGQLTSSNNFARTDINYDYAIAGIPFVAGISNTRNSYFRRRYTRDLQQISKAQFDNAQNPGEQSFTGWWLRSQASWHGGAGITYMDTGLDSSLQIRFQDSYGVNPWTINQLTLLNTTNQALSSANTNLLVRSINVSGVDYLLCADGTTLKRLTGVGTSLTYTVTGMTGTISSITDDGTNYYVATTSGVYSGPLTNGSAGVLYYTTNGSANVSLGWVKGRLAVSQDNYVYLGLAALATLGTGNGTFHHLSTGWVWTNFDDGPNAIYAAGNGGAQSEIWRASVDNTGAVPTIVSGVTTAVMPRGEIINNIYSYLQTFLAICTSKGVRIAAINSDGSITYGQLLWSTDSFMGNTSPVQGVIGTDRFLYVGISNVINGSSGAARIDLGTTVTGTSTNSSFAYAKDVSSHTTGTVLSVAALGNSQLIATAVSGKGVYVQDPNALETSGSLLTSRIRYNTTEPKLFKFLTVRTPNTFAGSINLFIDDPTGAENSITTINQATFSTANLGLSFPNTASEWVALRFTLNQGSTTTGPVMNNWQLKAMPGTTRQRLITVPLILVDHAKDKMGNRVGQTGQTWITLQQFEAVATKGDVVLFQDLNTGETQVVVINDYEFEQLAEPQQNGEGIGGFLTLSLLTIS